MSSGKLGGWTDEWMWWLLQRLVVARNTDITHCHRRKGIEVSPATIAETGEVRHLNCRLQISEGGQENFYYFRGFKIESLIRNWSKYRHNCLVLWSLDLHNAECVVVWNIPSRGQVCVVDLFLMLIEWCLSVRLQTMVQGDAYVMMTPSCVANYIHLYLMIA
jgi:hypothetical protein